jgi:hypothetical protein
MRLEADETRALAGYREAMVKAKEQEAAVSAVKAKGE